MHCSNNPIVFHTHRCRAAQYDRPGTMVAASFGTSGKCTVDCVQQSSSTSQTPVSCFWCASESAVARVGGANHSAAVGPGGAVDAALETVGIAGAARVGPGGATEADH